MKNLKKFYQQHAHKINPAVRLFRECVHEVTTIAEKPNIFDYIDLGFSIKEKYTNIYDDRDPRTFFDKEYWKAFGWDVLSKKLAEIFATYYPEHVTKVFNKNGFTGFAVNLEDHQFGWIVSGEKPIDPLDSMYHHVTSSPQFLEKIFWKHMPHSIFISRKIDGYLVFESDLGEKDFVITRKSREYCEYLKKFKVHGISRSIILYGPPGTGKSNLIRGICSLAQLRSIRFSDLKDISPNFIVGLINHLRPGVVVLEDVDQYLVEDLGDILTKIEQINNNGTMVLATVNQVSKLNNALLRPGRFDEAVEINKLDSEVILELVGNDSELYHMVEDWPVAFINELMKRIRALGKEEALNKIQDLKDRVRNHEMINYSLIPEHKEKEEAPPKASLGLATYVTSDVAKPTISIQKPNPRSRR